MLLLILCLLLTFIKIKIMIIAILLTFFYMMTIAHTFTWNIIILMNWIVSKEKKCFGIHHANIVAPLNKNIEDLDQFQGTLEFKFPITGLYEHTIGNNRSIDRTDLLVHSFCYVKTRRSCCGTRFSIHHKFSFKRSNVLQISMNNLLESNLI